MKKTVAVLNSSEEVTSMLQLVLEDAGFKTYSMYTHAFKENKNKFVQFVEQHAPDAIVYDIAVPYLDNYKLFKKLSSLDIVKNIPFILTTTNKPVLEKIAGNTNAYELIGKPYDLNEIIKAVKHAIKLESSA